MNDDYGNFVKQFKRKTGIDLLLYKEAQMKRRLTSLRDKRGYTSFSSYFEDFQKNSSLFYELLDRMTINVSEFYRNRKRWEILEKKVLTHLMKGQTRLKVWSAACSTGEEPYTLAMILQKHLPARQIEIVATDIDRNALKRAEMGVYPESALKELPAEMKKKHFTYEDNQMYKISDNIKKCVTFKQHNLLADQYEKKCDLIVCRNVLIYFTEPAKKYVYHRFNESLKREGVFFVGSTEQIFSPDQYNFEFFDTFFYKKVI
ncbi:CheR family methyltransferase [Halobacillus campisalis]|uniref:protein-glutamate O-methyltransferase n=1 Tax=Halobacillus campisalis TaxID=435909 RepID=A0ABW2K3H3_9BACI|nr:protein-glutamate O-methyltransferase CheR [Halobacillus campisalis]